MFETFNVPKFYIVI